MKIKMFVYLLVICELFFSLLSCRNKNEKGDISAKYQLNGHIIGKAADPSKGQTLICVLENKSDSLLYIPENPWYYYSGDTLYAEAVHKGRNKNDSGIIYNQFNPPILEELRPDSSVIIRVDYKNFTNKVPIFVAIRIYNKKYPYDPKKDYANYYSSSAFLTFDEKNSFLSVMKVN